MTFFLLARNCWTDKNPDIWQFVSSSLHKSSRYMYIYILQFSYLDYFLQSSYLSNGHNEQLKLNIFVLFVFFLLVWNTLSWVALFAGIFILYLLYYIIYLSSLYYKYIVNLIFLQLFELLFMKSFSCFRFLGDAAH